MILRILTTIGYASLVVTVIAGSNTFFMQYAYSPNDQWPTMIVKLFVGIYLYLIFNGLAIGLLVRDLCKEDDDEVHQSQSNAYARKLSTGFLKETHSQTKSEMFVTVLNSTPKFPQVPQLQNWVCTNRKSASTSALHYNSFNFDSCGIVLSCEKFIVKNISTTFEDLTGIEDLKQNLLNQVVTPFVLGVKSEIDITRGILLTGNEGTGKSSIVEAIVNKLRETSGTTGAEIRLYRIDGANCFGCFIGSGGATFHDVFKFAMDTAPSVLLFDHIENLYHRSACLFISELTSALKGKVLVIATTSKKRFVHEKLLQPGRFDFVYDIALPDPTQRAAILKLHLSKRNCVMKQEELDELAHLTTNLSGGELERLVTMINANSVENSHSKFTLFSSPSGCNIKEVKLDRWVLAVERFMKETSK
ncbi:Proteasome-activating nucleotidase [Orchesella cincta]|uniref:Proteasome-activating nucleotidase n=1 Tax=Orchesella cincta TaxID=48709 RepID=A0A1D2NGS3_ORCCI|nr:Proteasome-activating nucleotidase [Orchesella cincta]